MSGKRDKGMPKACDSPNNAYMFSRQAFQTLLLWWQCHAFRSSAMMEELGNMARDDGIIRHFR